MSLNVVRPGFGAQDPQVDSGWHESHVQFDPNSYERVQAEHIPSDDAGEKHKGARVHHDVFHLVHGKKQLTERSLGIFMSMDLTCLSKLRIYSNDLLCDNGSMRAVYTENKTNVFLPVLSYFST